MAVKSWLIPKEEMEATTSAAHDASAYDPKRSDPIPAMSPTLSPTLSAITCNITEKIKMKKKAKEGTFIQKNQTEITEK